MFYIKAFVLLVCLAFALVWGIKKANADTFESVLEGKEITAQGVCEVPFKDGTKTNLPCVELSDPKQPKKSWIILFDPGFSPLAVVEAEGEKKKVIWQFNWTDV